MIRSMTGFGTASYHQGDLSLSVEIRSLNSKFLDLALRLPKSFSDREVEIRNLVAEKLDRGKVSVTVEHVDLRKAEMRQTFNKELFVAYYAELKKLADRVMAPSYDPLFSIALNAPDVIVGNGKETTGQAEWEKLSQLLSEAIKQFDEFRLKEGRALEQKLLQYADAIDHGLSKVESLDPPRIERIRNKIKGSVSEFFGSGGYDPNRLEQEIIYYIEKLDIHEERVRLRTHLDYFREVLKTTQANGKRLGFVAQEIGREINTIGAKANDAEMQKQVVIMKEELEKIKEQLNNVL